MKQAYPVFIAKQDKDFLVYVPDMDLYTEGNSVADAMEMARDAIGLKGIDMEDSGIELPNPSNQAQALEKAKQDADIFDYSQGTLTLVDVDFSEYRKKMDNKTVRRNVTLPNWLNLQAEKAGINVSRVLQEALMAKLNVSK
ncbi:MAG TPA: type II toxin-antitoxin system HicB family antitoxin [Candidatus Scybalocola faecigallinarum]|uniref:Type II toxin-antitoxin system HicB family antitoxin n=1 Tax=Candidatus Scybalocola faecigallinarum TaxID=2840941 RepID=A0A9D1JQM3_9FIRM|nr:type II toxin-antitoxin system HicB family antitoxin [Candidatus Scybalocola faecigallinarum]